MRIKQTYFKAIFNLFNDRFKNREQNSLKLAEINRLVDKCMSVLDEEFQVPENLTERILANKPQITTNRILRINYTDYAQIAAVLAIGVFLGFVLGKHADTNILLSKENKKKKFLMEYRDSHYLTVDRTFLIK